MSSSPTLNSSSSLPHVQRSLLFLRQLLGYSGVESAVVAFEGPFLSPPDAFLLEFLHLGKKFLLVQAR